MEQDELLQAAVAGDIDTVRHLVGRFPSLASCRDGAGISAIRHALYRGHRDIAELLAGAGADLDEFDAAALGRTRHLQLVLDLEPSRVESWSTDGFQPLHFAAFFGHLDAVTSLLRRGAPVDEPSHNGMGVRPLHSAAANDDDASRLAVATELLAAGADPNAKQQGGFTALHAAAEHGDQALAQVLIDHGADVRITNDDGATPAALAIAADHLSLGAALTP
jgi:uncharacterized protein